MSYRRPDRSFFAHTLMQPLKGNGRRARRTAAARARRRVFQPGQHWHYGYNTDVVGRLVECISGQPLDEFLRARVFAPLGMYDTGFDVTPA